MNLLKKLLFTDDKSQHFANRLHEKITHSLGDISDQEALVISCLAGLLARVAYSDLEIKESEKKKIQEVLISQMKLSGAQAQLVSDLAITELTELSGLENHKYGQALIDILSEQERYKILQAMFSIAASDDEVSNLESEEIRTICKSLNLEHKHFVAARAQVKDFLAALK